MKVKLSRYQRLKNQGLCPICGLVQCERFCNDCLKKTTSYKRKEAGLCSVCGLVKVEKTYCDSCADKMSEKRFIKRRAKYAEY